MQHWRITGNSNAAIKTRSTYIFDSMIDISANSTANLGVWPLPVRRNWPPAIATTTDNWKLQYGRFARQSRNFWQSVVVAMISLIICWARHHRKSRIWRANLDTIRHSSIDVIISGFGGHIDISDCRSLLYLLTDIITPGIVFVRFLCFFVINITRKRLDRFARNFQGRCGVTMGRPDYILGQFG